MKFELEPDNRNCNGFVLLEDLRRVAAELGKRTLTKDDYNAKGRFCAATMQKRFGSWNSALEKSGLSVDHRKNIPEDQLLENIERIWERLGRQPMRKDFQPSQSQFSCETYQKRFGSLRKALESFVASVNEDRPLAPESASDACANVIAPKPKSVRHKTSRTISWRMRFLVMRRDNFKCRITGRSPATDPSVILDVDHIVPWAKGGETVMENLQTLCREINIGKSNLDMHHADADVRQT
jgi:hypothetical protein